MNEETKVLITGPGKYPTRRGRHASIVEVKSASGGHNYPAHGYTSYSNDFGPAGINSLGYPADWRLDGYIHNPGLLSNDDIIGPRIEDAKPVPQPTVQDGIVGVEGLPPIAQEFVAKLKAKTPEERDEWVRRFNGDLSELRPKQPAMERYGAYAAKWPEEFQLTFHWEDEWVAVIRRSDALTCRKRGATPDLALAAAMDVIEGLA